jgi:hypothetical protein
MSRKKMKRNPSPLIIVAIALAAGCAILFQVYAKKCLWWDCAPPRSFELSELNIPADYFPENADIGQLHQLSEYYGAIMAEVAESFWKTGDGRANLLAFQYANFRGASREYDFFLKRFFVENTPAPLKAHPSVTFESEIAEEYFVACGEVEYFGRTSFQCDLVAQYQEFFISFGSDIDSEMSFQEFEKIVIFLDQRMKEVLFGDK